jgi:hypothetical protein
MKRRTVNVTCREAELWISVRVDGERLEGAPAGDLDAHLERCERCRRTLAGETARAARLRRTLAADVDPASIAALKDAVLAGLAAASTQGATEASARGGAAPILRSPLFRRGALSVAAVLVVGFGIWFFAGPPAPQPPDAASETALGSGPWRIIVEDTRWDARPTFSRDGNHWLRDVETQRRIILDPLPVGLQRGDPGRQGGGGVHDIWLDREEVQTNYLRFTGWSYH